MTQESLLWAGDPVPKMTIWFVQERTGKRPTVWVDGGMPVAIFVAMSGLWYIKLNCLAIERYPENYLEPGFCVATA